MHDRISNLDSRVDQIEISIAQNYVQRSELKEQMRSFEAHMIRMESKLDTFIASFHKNQ